MAVGSGITLKQTDPADIPTPTTAKDTLFVDSTVSPPAPAYKDDAGVTRPLRGGTGSTGPMGPIGIPGSDGDDPMVIPGPPGPVSSNPVPQRTSTITSSATPAINSDTTDIFTITALATAITSMSSSLTGTPVNGQHLTIRLLDDGTARGITWGASYASRGATLPITTVLSKYLYVGLIWNSTATVWDCVATSQET